MVEGHFLREGRLTNRQARRLTPTVSLSKGWDVLELNDFAAPLISDSTPSATRLKSDGCRLSVFAKILISNSRLECLMHKMGSLRTGGRALKSC